MNEDNTYSIAHAIKESSVKPPSEAMIDGATGIMANMDVISATLDDLMDALRSMSGIVKMLLDATEAVIGTPGERVGSEDHNVIEFGAGSKSLE